MKSPEGEGPFPHICIPSEIIRNGIHAFSLISLLCSRNQKRVRTRENVYGRRPPPKSSTDGCDLAMSGWGGSTDSSYARNITNHVSDSDDDMWRDRHRQREKDEEKRAYFGVVRRKTLPAQ